MEGKFLAPKKEMSGVKAFFACGTNFNIEFQTGRQNFEILESGNL